MVAQRDGQFNFIGRKWGVINVGGAKVHPEEVEDVLVRHSSISMVRVSPRRNPLTGFVVAADLVLREPIDEAQFADLKRELREFCGSSLAHHKVPMYWQRVETIEVAAAGKVKRH